VLLGLGESHRFEDGFTVTMGPVDRRTDPPLIDDSATGTEESTEEGTDPADGLEDDQEDGLDEEPEDWDEDDWEEDDWDEDVDGEGLPEDEDLEEDPVEEPQDDEIVDEEPEDEGDDYYAWTTELSNGGDAQVHTGSVFSECSVGTPLRLSSAPLLGEALNPPMTLAPDEQGSWDVDCWADEDDDPSLQWTLEFVDEQGERLYPVLVFEGQVG
jgi:hypothetical protein